jgi:hypothetical protein
MVQASIVSPRRTEREGRTDGLCLLIRSCFILLSEIERFLNGSKFETEHTHTHTHTEHGDTQVPSLLP